MAEPKSEENQQNNPLFFLSLIPKFLSKPFEFLNKNDKAENGKSVKRDDSDDVSVNKSKSSDVVKFPRSQADVSPIKLESEDVQEDTNPLILWQVYALGGFIILKWAWGKWQEKKARSKDDASGEEQPSPPAPGPTAPAQDSASGLSPGSAPSPAPASSEH